MASAIGSMCFDEYGRAFIIVKGEECEARLTGLDALKSHIQAARQVADSLKTSLGPKGMDKLLVTPDGEVVITNDGATILELMDVEHEVAKLLVGLARSQDLEVGDGTTGVVVLAGALLERALELLDKGVHPTRVAEGYERAARFAADHLKKISITVPVHAEDTKWLLQAAMTALSSKVANKCKLSLAEMAVNAFKATCNLNDDNPMIHVNSVVLRGKSGGKIEDTEMIQGVIIGKDFVHPQMDKSFICAKVAVFSGAALQLPAVNAKHELSVGSTQGYRDIRQYMEEWSGNVLQAVVESGAKIVVYSGIMDESVVHLFLQHGVSAVEGVADVQIVAASVGARAVPRVEELTADKLGVADKVSVVDFGTTSDKCIVLQQLETPKIATIFVRGSNEVVVEEVKRSVQDALCVVRNLVKEKCIVFGGGAAEISCSLAVQEESLKFSDLDQLVYQAFADALDVIPMTLAQNAGLFPLQVLTELKAHHEPSVGVDCLLTGDNDMRDQGVVEGLQAKRHQLLLASQLAAVVLKIDDVRGPSDVINK